MVYLFLRNTKLVFTWCTALHGIMCSRSSFSYARMLFNIDIETCSECGGDVKIIASIEDPVVIQKILAHLDGNATSIALNK